MPGLSKIDLVREALERLLKESAGREPTARDLLKHLHAQAGHKVRRQARVLMKDVLAYKQAMRVKSRAAMDELVKLSEEVGGYDL